MAVTYLPIDGEEVSKQWFSLLKVLRHEGVSFNVNEGHRTMARQWYFWRLYKSGRGNLAAFPSPFAPHIRTGRFDHAIDFNNASGVQAAARRHGVTLSLTVPGESWHLEANAKQLEAFYLKHREEPTIKRGSHGKAVSHLKHLLRTKWGMSGFVPGRWFGKGLEKAVKRWQKRHGLKIDGIVGPATWKRIKGH